MHGKVPNLEENGRRTVGNGKGRWKWLGHDEELEPDV